MSTKQCRRGQFTATAARAARVLAVVVAMTIVLGVAQATDYSLWNYKSRISMAGYTRSGTLTNFPVLVVLGTNIPNFKYSQMGSVTGGDLRFTGTNGTDDLNFEIDQWNTNGNSYVWVQLPTLASTNDFLYAYWGQTGQTLPPCTTNGSTWSNAYTAVWHMNQTNAKDSTSNTNNGTGTANTNATGVIGTAQGFNGSAYIQCPTAASFDAVTNAVTISAWVYLRNGASYPMVFTRGQDKMEVRFENGSRQLNFESPSSCMVGAGDATPLNTWTHFACTYDIPTASQRVMINGRVVQTSSSSSAMNGHVGSAVYLGKRADGYNMDGLIDEMQMSSVARSTNWIWATWLNMASNTAFTSYGQVQSATPFVSNANGATNVTTTAAWINGTLLSTGTSDTAVIAYWGTSDGGTNPGAWANTITWGAPQTPGNFTTNLTLSPDTIYYYRFAASNTAGTNWSDSSVPFATSAVWVDKTSDAAEQGVIPGTFTVHRASTATNAALTVNFSVGGSAVAGLDYANNLGTSVTFAPGASNATVVVTPIVNNASNADSSVTLTIIPGSYVIGAPASATMTITNWPFARPATFWVNASSGDDTRPLQLAVNPATPWKTITYALSQASSGDTINVAAGTYTEGSGTEATPLIMKNGVTLQGAGFTNTTITIASPFQGNLLTATSLTTGKVDGFTFTGIGDGDPCSGVIVLNSSTLTISNNRIKGNQGRGNGWGIRCLGGGSPLIKNNVINANWNGGGIQVSAGTPTIQNCTIIANSVGLSCGGGTPIVKDCIIWNNGGDVGGLSASMVSNCCIKSGAFNGTNGCFATDPLMTAGYFLSQIAAGQASNSPCLNAGSQSATAAGMDAYTSRTDGQPDAGTVDIGYHFPPGAMSGGTVYVAKTGNDTTGTGSSGSPWLTITKAMNLATYGTVINVATGTYREGANVYMVDGVTLQGSGYTNCIIDRNGQGQAIACYYISSGKIDGFTLTGVLQTDNTFGLLLQTSSFLVSNCRIYFNQARSGGSGIEIDTPASRPELRNLLVDRNYYSGSGPAINISASAPILINCTIVSNLISSAAIAVVSSGTPTIQNCIFWNNQNTSDVTGVTAAMISNCDLQSGAFNTNGCISVDPQFVAATNNNYRLNAGSPCIDTGTNQSWMATYTDLAGNPRLSGTRLSTRIVDMGVFEYQYPVRRGTAAFFR